MAVKLLAFDLDDTLLKNDRTIGERTIRALRAAHEKGVLIVPATGRGAQTMWNFVEQIDAVDAVVTTNGSQVLDRAHRVIFENTIALPQALQVVSFAEENGWYIQGYSADDFYYERVTEETRLYQRFGGHEGTAIGRLSENMKEAPYKLIFIETDMEKMARLRNSADALFAEQLNLFVSKPFYYEVTAKGCTKGETILHLARMHGISREEIMCCGDSDNDLSMIDMAGYGVVVANAREEVKKHADILCPSNEEEGVAQVIEQYIL